MSRETRANGAGDLPVSRTRHALDVEFDLEEWFSSCKTTAVICRVKYDLA